MSRDEEGRTWEILMVEDNPVDVLVTREALKNVSMKHHLHVVEDGEQACDFLFRRGRHSGALQPDLILLDLNLPKKNGREILSEIKCDPSLRHIPVVIFSTSESQDDAASCRELRADAFVTKPLDFGEFCSTVRAIVECWIGVAAWESVTDPITH
jgi:CheY-like chemotaxis protein